MILLADSNPLPYGLMALWLTLPGIWQGAGALTGGLTADRAVRRILQPAAALAAWIVFVQLAAMAARSYWIGLPIGMTLLSAFGWAIWWLTRNARSAMPTEIAPPAIGSKGMWVGMVLITLPIAVMACLGHFHDDLHPNGHLSFIAQLENGSFPPRFLGFSNIPLRYHFGFDIVCAGLIAMTRMRVDQAIRVLTIFDWTYCWCLLWVLGERLSRYAKGGLLTALTCLLGGGCVVLFAPIALHHFAKADTFWRSLLGMYSLGDNLRLRITVLEYSFSHPFSLAFPLMTAALLAQLSPPNGKGWGRFAIIGLIVASLPIVNYVAFITTVAAITFVEVIIARRWKYVIVLLAATAIYVAESVYTHVQGSPSLGLYPRFWFTEYSGLLWPARVALWHLVIFIPLLPLGALGARNTAVPVRWTLLLLAGGSLIVPVFVGYAYSFDIMKFSVIGLFALGILAGVELSRLTADSRPSFRIAFGVALVASTLSAVVAMIGIVWGQVRQQEDLGTYYEGPVSLESADREAAEWLRTRAGTDEIIYRKPSVALGYMQLYGLSATAEAKNTGQFGVPDEIARQQAALLEDPPANLEPYLKLGIVWFVSSPDDPGMEQNILRWARDGKLAKKAEFGSLRIYKVVEPDPRTAARDASPTAN